MDKGKKSDENDHGVEEKNNSSDKKSEKADKEVTENEKVKTKTSRGENVKKQGSGEIHIIKKDHTGKRSVKKSKKKKGKDLGDLLDHKNEIIEEIRKELAQTKEMLEVKEDRLLRMVAEFDNFKKRINREQNLLKKRMYSDVFGELLPVLDDFERAFEVQIGDGDDFSKGIKLIYSRLNNILTHYGVKEINADGQTFNPEFHEAMGEVDCEGVEGGKVAHVVLKGYMFDDVVIRPARVMVSRGKIEKEE